VHVRYVRYQQMKSSLHLSQNGCRRYECVVLGLMLAF
jgi:hypothetical protein